MVDRGEAMNAGDEIALYTSDRAAWLAYFAPRIAEILNESTNEELDEIWSRMKRDTQLAAWPLLNEVTHHKLLKRLANMLESISDDELLPRWSRVKNETQANLWPLLSESTQFKLAALAPTKRSAPQATKITHSGVAEIHNTQNKESE
jgi:hypothetical protein